MKTKALMFNLKANVNVFTSPQQTHKNALGQIVSLIKLERIPLRLRSKKIRHVFETNWSVENLRFDAQSTQRR